MNATGQAGGAATIVNAMATGSGAAFGLDLRVRADVARAPRWAVWSAGRRLDAARARLAIKSAMQVSPQPLRIQIDSQIPPERGLKSSSAVAVATIRAAARLHQRRWSDERVLEAAAEAGLQSGTSITGAYDDAAACLLGGIVFTDNRRRRILARRRLLPSRVALVHPGRKKLATSSVKGTSFEPIRAIIHDAYDLALHGDLRSAMLLNTAAYAPLFGHDTKFTATLIQRGAYAAGLSGKGPAQVAILTPAAARAARPLFPGSIVVALRPGRVP